MSAVFLTLFKVLSMIMMAQEECAHGASVALVTVASGFDGLGPPTVSVSLSRPTSGCPPLARPTSAVVVHLGADGPPEP